MQIIDKYKDYYDSIQRLGIDPDIVFVRKPEVIQLQKYWNKLVFYKNKRPAFVKQILIGFCGNLYPALGIDDLVIYSDAELDKLNIFQQVGYKRELLKQNNYFEKLKLNKYDYFDKYKTPIWVIESVPPGGEYLTINARLKPYFFVKIFSPEAAYQTLYQYLAKQNRGEKPIPVVDDKTLAEAKGFNKWSFRKPSVDR